MIDEDRALCVSLRSYTEEWNGERHHPGCHLIAADRIEALGAEVERLELRWFSLKKATEHHREQAERETVAKIVAWLREQMPSSMADLNFEADAIEAGEWKR